MVKVFISWSGERSRRVAEALRVWLPRVIQSIKPWMSDNDIEAGARWLAEVSKVLDDANIGIICVTPENLNSPWLHFEAGAISRALDESRVYPVGLGLTPGQIKGPLSQFQAVALDQPGVLKVLSSLNKLLGAAALPEPELEAIFSVWWAELEKRLSEIPKSEAPPVARSQSDQLEELLQLSREHLRRENVRLEGAMLMDGRMEAMAGLLKRSLDGLEPARAQLKSIAPLMEGLSRALEESDGSGAITLENLGAHLPGLQSLVKSGAFKLDTSALQEMARQTEHMMLDSREVAKRLRHAPDSGDSTPPAVNGP